MNLNPKALTNAILGCTVRNTVSPGGARIAETIMNCEETCRQIWRHLADACSSMSGVSAAMVAGAIAARTQCAGEIYRAWARDYTWLTAIATVAAADEFWGDTATADDVDNLVREVARALYGAMAFNEAMYFWTRVAQVFGPLRSRS